MKRRVAAFTVLLFLLITTASAQNNSINYLIKGKVNGADTGVIYLHIDNGGENINSARLDSGRFVLTGKVTEPLKCTLYSNFNYDAIPIFLENTQYEILIDNMPFSYKVTGGKLQQEFMEYGNTIFGYYEGWSKIKQILAKKALWESTGITNNLRNELDSSVGFLENEIIEKSAVFIKEDTDSYVAPRIISNLLLLDKKYVSKVEVYYEMLSERIKLSAEAKDLKKRIDNLKNAPRIGYEARDFKLRNYKNKEISFTKPGKGKYVLLNFWASWCLPCVQEFPSLRRIYNKFKDKGFEIINISLDTDKQRWLKYIYSNKFPWPQLIDMHADSSVAKMYKITSIPSNFLIDERMRIVEINLSENKLEDELDKVLNKKLRDE